MEGFCEQIIKKERNAKDGIINAGIILASIVVAFILHYAFTMMKLNVFAVLFALTAIVLGIRFVGMRKYEYEYTMTDGEIDFELIIAQSRRKRLLSVNCRDFEIVAPANRGNYMGDYKNLKIKDFSAFPQNDANYFAVTSIDGERVVLLFEPSEAMLRMFRQIIPRKTFMS